MKYKATMVFVLSVSVNAISGAAWPDSYAGRHSCQKPSEPWGTPSRREVEHYHDDADRYERCLRDFALEQQEEAQNHRGAARQAQSELDDFTRKEFDLDDEEDNPFKSRRW